MHPQIAGTGRFVFVAAKALLAVLARRDILDEDGTHTANLDFDIASGELGGHLYDATMVANIFDVGGRPNPRVISRPLDTQDSYLGMKPGFEGMSRQALKAGLILSGSPVTAPSSTLVTRITPCPRWIMLTSGPTAMAGAIRVQEPWATGAFRHHK